MTTLTSDRPSVDLTARRRVGRGYLAAAGTFVFYVVVLATTSAGYEQALTNAADDAGVAVNRLPAETLAQIGQDHPWSILANLVLVLLPVTLLLATRRAAAVSGDRWGVRLAACAAVVWGCYLVLNLGLLADPGSLPPLTRDLDLLTVPLVSLGSVLSLTSFVLSVRGLRRLGWRRVATAIAVLVVVADLVISAGLLVTSGFEEPIAPIALLPAELIVGIALLVRSRR